MKTTDIFTQCVVQYRTWQQSVNELRPLCDIVRASSKRAVALLRRDHVRDVAIAFREAEAALKRIARLIRAHPRLVELGFYSEALEEYVEAKAFEACIANRALQLPPYVSVDIEEVIGGICDMTGELVRHAITLADDTNRLTIERYRLFADHIAEVFSQAALGGKLRSKYDDLERNVKRLEQILYDLRIRMPGKHNVKIGNRFAD